MITRVGPHALPQEINGRRHGRPRRECRGARSRWRSSPRGRHTRKGGPLPNPRPDSSLDSEKRTVHGCVKRVGSASFASYSIVSASSRVNRSTRCRSAVGARASVSMTVTSSLVRNARPSYSDGRSSGVSVEPTQMPCRSGSPHEVLGASWAETPVPSATASAVAAIGVENRARFLSRSVIWPIVPTEDWSDSSAIWLSPPQIRACGFAAFGSTEGARTAP